MAALVLVACEKEPNLSELSADYMVYTDYDKSVNFSNYSTYYLPDSVLVIGNSDKATYWTNEKADFLLSVLVENMSANGFIRVKARNEADMGLQICYIENTRYFVNYPMYDYWWWGYPGYWDPYYWGYWNQWYYPYYPTVYKYSTNSFITELVDLKDKPAEPVKEGDVRRLNVIWNSYMAGAKGGSAQAYKKLVTRAIDQAFVQSPYLTNK